MSEFWREKAAELKVIAKHSAECDELRSRIDGLKDQLAQSRQREAEYKEGFKESSRDFRNILISIENLIQERDQLRAKITVLESPNPNTNELLGALSFREGIRTELIKRTLSENDQLAADLKTAREALEKRQRLGHHDTCEAMLSSEYGCSCGYDKAKQALAQITEGK